MSKTNPMYKIGQTIYDHHRHPAPLIKQYEPEPEPYLIYKPWQKDLGSYLQDSKEKITCVYSNAQGSGITTFIQYFIHMNKNAILFDAFNPMSLVHAMPQLIAEGNVPRTIFIDLEFIEDKNMIFYKVLKFLFDGICPLSVKYPGSRLFEIDNIVIFGYRYPFYIDNLTINIWTFLLITPEQELLDICFHSAFRVINLQHKMERLCPCVDCKEDCELEVIEVIHTPELKPEPVQNDEEALCVGLHTEL